MAASGEPYSTAARELGATGPGSDPAAAGKIVERANSTLAAPRARIEVRTDRDFSQVPGRRERRRPSPAVRLIRFAANAAWTRFSPGMDLASAFGHQAGEGFVEPAADRYQIDFGAYALMYVNGLHYGGPPGRMLEANHRHRKERNERNDPLELLRKLRDVTDARYVGHETVRGTPCRSVAVRAGSAEFTIWIDDEHIRRIQAGESWPSFSETRTLELWDFGAEDGSADWTRLPSLRTVEHRPGS
jgi:hypothetical protein